jgi:hypothetical protein
MEKLVTEESSEKLWAKLRDTKVQGLGKFLEVRIPDEIKPSEILRIEVPNTSQVRAELKDYADSPLYSKIVFVDVEVR